MEKLPLVVYLKLHVALSFFAKKVFAVDLLPASNLIKITCVKCFFLNTTRTPDIHKSWSGANIFTIKIVSERYIIIKYLIDVQVQYYLLDLNTKYLTRLG